MMPTSNCPTQTRDPNGPPPMKKGRYSLASNATQVTEGAVLTLPVQKMIILNPRKMEEVLYFARASTPELFNQLMDSKQNEQHFNVSLLTSSVFSRTATK